MPGNSSLSIPAIVRVPSLNCWMHVVPRVDRCPNVLCHHFCWVLQSPPRLFLWPHHHFIAFAVGSGYSPIPEKLVTKIRTGQFINLADLLNENLILTHNYGINFLLHYLGVFHTLGPPNSPVCQCQFLCSIVFRVGHSSSPQ